MIGLTHADAVYPLGETDFSAAQFRAMGAHHGLVERADLLQVQRMSPFELLRGNRFKRENLREKLPQYYLRHPSAALKRLTTTLRHGFANLYLTLVWQRGD